MDLITTKQWFYSNSTRRQGFPLFFESWCLHILRKDNISLKLDSSKVIPHFGLIKTLVKKKTLIIKGLQQWGIVTFYNIYYRQNTTTFKIIKTKSKYVSRAIMFLCELSTLKFQKQRRCFSVTFYLQNGDLYITQLNVL